VSVVSGNGGIGAGVASVGGSGGLVTVQSGSGAVGVATGGSGGAIAITTGAGAVGTAGGSGGQVTVSTGAGAATNGSSANIVLAPGVGDGTGQNGTVVRRMPSVAGTAATGATLTPKQVLTGYISITGAGAGNITLPTGTDLSAAMPNCALGDTVQLIVVNKTAAAGILTFVANGATMVGNGLLVQQIAGACSVLYLTKVTAPATNANWEFCVVGV
jgi:hypothetical protein